MVGVSELQIGQEYRCQQALNLYQTPRGESLVTQAAIGRHLRVLAMPASADAQAVQVCLCEDDYPGWLATPDWQHLQIASQPYQAAKWTAPAIQAQIPAVLKFAQAAMQQPNTYLWGGTVGPNYDCSGLVQAVFAAVGIRLPRDSYQQEAFVEPVAIADLIPGDLIFFGTRDRATHVALYQEQGQYIHSSGKDQGRNGIGIDSLVELTDPISQTYFQQLRGAGRVIQSYTPTGNPILCR